jgi:uncharacterized membrane protein YsdA (DUF1294 family)
VELDGSAVFMLAEMLLLVMALLFGFAGIFQLMERRRFRAASKPFRAAPEFAS